MSNLLSTYAHFTMLMRTGMMNVIISVFAYTLLFYINSWITTELVFGLGVNWIYLPAGLRLFLTLIFGLPGAIGIAIASTLISYYGELSSDLAICIGTGLISGFAPYLARIFVFSNVKLESDLSNLNLQKLLLCIVIYALMSAGLHQYWYAIVGLENTGSVNHFAVMAIGDVMGSILLIALIKSGLDLMRRFRRIDR
ncbi:MAG: hypothetical protein RJB15_1029 [Pseudomonadota bacterium]|jgi:hypothetical protein